MDDHAVATELPVIVSAVLGRASPAFTIAVYQHAWQEGPEEAAEADEAALGPLALTIRWQDEGSRRPAAAVSARTRRSDEWGGQDSNLRPTDYESENARTADLQRLPEVLVKAIT